MKRPNLISRFWTDNIWIGLALLKTVKNYFRLQVDQVVEACPSTTLNDKLRSLITAELTAPMATSAEIKKRRKNAKKSSSSPSKAVEKSVSSSSSTSSSQNGSFLGSLTKLLFYAILTIGCMSQIGATRPTYEAYAGPYVEQYVEVSWFIFWV